MSGTFMEPSVRELRRGRESFGDVLAIEGSAEAHERGALQRSRTDGFHALAAQPFATTPTRFPRLRMYDATVKHERTPSGRSRPGERQTRLCSFGGLHAEEEAGSLTFLAEAARAYGRAGALNLHGKEGLRFESGRGLEISANQHLCCLC